MFRYRKKMIVKILYFKLKNHVVLNMILFLYTQFVNKL